MNPAVYRPSATCIARCGDRPSAEDASLSIATVFIPTGAGKLTRVQLADATRRELAAPTLAAARFASAPSKQGLRDQRSPAEAPPGGGEAACA
eukprot:4379746-Prymnesium_polylepis.2